MVLQGIRHMALVDTRANGAVLATGAIQTAVCAVGAAQALPDGERRSPKKRKDLEADNIVGSKAGAAARPAVVGGRAAAPRRRKLRRL